MKIWVMRIACWITKATKTHTEYVILTAFPWQHWLHEGPPPPSLLRYKYIFCLIVEYLFSCWHDWWSTFDFTALFCWQCPIGKGVHCGIFFCGIVVQVHVSFNIRFAPSRNGVMSIVRKIDFIASLSCTIHMLHRYISSLCCLFKSNTFSFHTDTVIEEVNARHPDVLLMTIKTYKLPSKHNSFIIIYYFRATCFDCLESSSGPLTNRPKTI